MTSNGRGRLALISCSTAPDGRRLKMVVSQNNTAETMVMPIAEHRKYPSTVLNGLHALLTGFSHLWQKPKLKFKELEEVGEEIEQEWEMKSI